jgi:hypothetical protein
MGSLIPLKTYPDQNPSKHYPATIGLYFSDTIMRFLLTTFVYLGVFSSPARVTKTGNFPVRPIS